MNGGSGDRESRAMAGPAGREIKFCCASFYESDVVRLLLGDVLHPGGLELTRRLGNLLNLNETDHVLDVACGRGVSAVHLARSFGCQVTGLDYSHGNIRAAEDHAREQELSHLTHFRRGDAEGLPLEDGTFDALVSECSFCTFPNKTDAAGEMARVLRSGGRLGLTDMTVKGRLPDDVQTTLGWVACVSGADSVEGYVETLERAGFVDFAVEDQSAELVALVNNVRRKCMGIELAVGLGKLDIGDLDLSEAKALTRRALDLIENETLGYALVVASMR
jgi:ubiquinone/menaquinone biosynthesis C-methylase UbiE